MYKNSVQRFRQIVKVLASYGFGYIVDSKFNNEKKSPQNLRKAMEELGATFIKIGQILSTRPDILPDPYIRELSKLQNNVPPETFESVNSVFRNEFHESIEDAFLSFDKKPFASASIAQVHNAVLKDGRKVIVKIQRPEIAEKMRLDIGILSKILKLTKIKFQDVIIDPIEALDEIKASTEREIDFKNEVHNMEKFKELNKNVAFLYTPYVIHSLSGSKVITMEKIEGFKVDDIHTLKKENYDLKDLGKKLVISYLKQVLQDGFFHGDPHPGNILIKDLKICFIDFGIMGTLSESLRRALDEIITAAAYKDINKVISVIMSIGIRTGHVDRNKLYDDIDYLFESYLNTSLMNIKISQMLEEVFDAAKRNNIRMPKELTLLARGLLIIEGVAAKIDPDIKIIDIAVPYVKSNNKNALLKNLNLDDILLSSLRFSKDISSLPKKIADTCDSITDGRAKFQLKMTNLDKPINELNKMVNRLIFSLIISSMIIGSSFIINSNVGPKIYNISIVGITGYLLAAVMGFYLIISIIRSGKL